MGMALPLVALMAVAVLAAAPADADDHGWEDVDVTAEVTDIQRTHGDKYDEMVFTVEVTNNERDTVWVELIKAYAGSGNLSSIESAYAGPMQECPPPSDPKPDPISVKSRKSVILTECFLIGHDVAPTMLSVVGWLSEYGGDVDFQHTLLFDADIGCWPDFSAPVDIVTCAEQDISGLVRDIHPAHEPVPEPATDVEIGPHADLSGADLSGADLSGADLTGADLAYADLWDADLSGADLTGADLAYADLWDADLSGADLTGADLAYAALWDADLSGANLTGADLAYAALWDADLSGADLTGADLAYAALWDADLAGANLAKANLEGADLSGANLAKANLEGADLAGADLWDADLTGATVCDGTALPGAVQVPCQSEPASESTGREPVADPEPGPAPARTPEPEPSGFTIHDAGYDWGADTLTLNFTGRVNIWNMDISRVSVSDGACAVSFTHGQLDIGRDRQSVTIRPDAEQRESLANMVGYEPYVLLRDGSFHEGGTDTAMEPVSIPLDMAGDHPYYDPKCTITYGYHDGLLASYADDYGPTRQAVHDGFTAWSDLNTYYTFRYVENDPLVWVDFVDYEPEYIGLACVWCLDSEPSMEVILYDYDCKGGRIHHDPSTVRNTVAHELGHILGLDHHTDDTHLMYGPEYQVDPYEAYGLWVPDMLEEWYVGEEALYTHARSLEPELDRLEAELERLEGVLDRLIGQADFDGTSYVGTQSEVNQYKRTYAEYEAVFDEYDAVWNEYDAAWDDLECMYDGDSPWHDDTPAVPDRP